MRAHTLAIAVWMALALTAAAVPAAHTPQHADSRMIVPLTDRPFERLVDPDSDAARELAGHARMQGWLTADAAWLVWDPDWRGQVRSHADLIGDGFEALQALDVNEDGELTGAELGGLALWRDENGNGISEPGEVLPANVHGIAALSVRGSMARPGLVMAAEGVRFEDGRTRPLYDWTPRADAS